MTPPKMPAKPEKKEEHKSTEEEVDMAATIGQRIDKKGTKVEDEAGNGEIDSEGG
jgi:hypothetical protein